MPDAVVAVDSKGLIRFINSKTEQLTGYLSAELVGERVEILVPASKRSSHKSNIDDFHTAPSAREMGDRRDLGLRKKDGVIVPVAISLSPLLDQNESIVITTIRDVSDRERRSKEDILLAEIGALVGAENDDKKLYKLLESTLPSLLKFDRIVITAKHPELDQIERLYVGGMHVSGNEAGTTIPTPAEYFSTALGIGSLQSSIPESALDGSNVSAARHAEAGLKSWLRVPLGDSIDPLGDLSLRSRDENAYDDEDLAMLNRVATVISPALENARLYAQIREEAHTRTVLAEIGKAVSSSTLVSEYFDTFADLAKK